MSCFFGEDEDFAFVGEGGGEEVEGAALADAGAGAEFGDGEGEVADGEVGLGEAGGELFEEFAGEVEGVGDAEAAPGEVGDEGVGGVEVAVAVEFGGVVAQSGEFEGAAFEEGGVRFVEIGADGVGGGEGGFFFFGEGEGEGEGVGASGVEVDGVDEGGGRGGGVAFEEEEEFFAFVAGGDDVHFAGFGEQAEGFPDVRHGGDFDDEAVGVFQEEGFQLEDVGFAVGEGEDAAVAVGAAGGVGVAGVGAEVAEEVAGVGVEDADAGGAEGGEVVAGGFAVEGVAFDVGDGGAGTAGEVVAVHAEPSGEVAAGGAEEEALFVAGGGFGGALFGGEAGGVDEVVVGVPFGQFVADLSAGEYLFDGEREVYSRVAGGCQQEFGGVLGGVVADELFECGGQLHGLPVGDGAMALSRSMRASPRALLSAMWRVTVSTKGLFSKAPRTRSKSTALQRLSPSAPKPVWAERENSFLASS